MRVFLAGAAAIALLFAVSLRVIAVGTPPTVLGAPRVQPVAAEPVLPPPAVPPRLAVLPPPAPPAPFAPAEPPTELFVIPPPPPEAPAAVQRAVAELQAHHSRVSFRQEMIAALASLHEAVASCEAGERLAETALVLALEGGDGTVRVVDAAASKAGRAGAADVACAVAALRGRVVAVPSAVPGRRWQMPFVPRPASARVAARRGG